MSFATRSLKVGIRGLMLACGYDMVESDPLGTQEKVLLKLLSECSINCVVDVGAHRGEYGRYLRSFGYGGHIVSFEPVGSSFEALQQVSAQDKRWRVYRLALGATSSRNASIGVAKSTSFSSFLEPNEAAFERFGERPQTARREVVEVRRLDEMLDEVTWGIDQPRLFMKIDTQGYDMRVLEGSQRVLSRFAGLQVELSSQPIYRGMTPMSEAVVLLREAGFVAAGLYPITRDAQLGVIEFDGLFVRKVLGSEAAMQLYNVAGKART